MHTWRLIAIPSPWQVTNLTIYSTLPTCTVLFGISKGVELAKLGSLARFHAQLVGLAAWQVPRTHQGTDHRSHYIVIFQLYWWFWHPASLAHKVTTVPV